MRETLDFLLLHWLDAAELTDRPRFAEHSLDTYGQVLDLCERVARDKFAPFNRLVDTEEPQFDGEKVILPAATRDAWDAYAASGMLAAAQDYEIGGMQLPFVIESAANAFFLKASVSIHAGLLTIGNANLLMAHGSGAQKQAFAVQLFSGCFSGTMCLSEPQAGSSLSDISTRALPDGEGHEGDPLGSRYRLHGSKMWISAGEHELTHNIVHLVLAKIPGPDGKPVPGIKGISLFIVPKKLVDVEGRLTGERNDVALAGLNHKCGWRGTTNTLLNFGEGRFPVRDKPGAIGYLVGEAGKGLGYMFHMMNEARIGVGLAATMLGMAGYEASLAYARQRPQGRHVDAAGSKDAAMPQVAIIEHADVKRMLLAQKSYSEGALALELYCARLVDERRTGTAESAAEAKALLEILTPIAKSWPSEWCLEANSLAIQVLGGSGYTRDFPVEQYWRDNRLNMIHEGTHGIQGLDLLGRKVLMDNGSCLNRLLERMWRTVNAAEDRSSALAASAQAVALAVDKLREATRAAWSTGRPEDALANATPYLQAFGHVVLGWIWLDLLLCVENHGADVSPAFAAGKRACARYFLHYELPKIDVWLAVVAARDPTCRDMQDEWF